MKIKLSWKQMKGLLSKETVVSSRCGVKHESFISKELVDADF